MVTPFFQQTTTTRDKCAGVGWNAQYKNRSRMGGKGVGNGLKYWKTNYLLYCHLVIFGYTSQIPVERFWCRCTHMTLIWCGMIVKNFVWIVRTVFETIEKFKNGHFWANFDWLFLRSQSYDFDVIAHTGAPFGVEWLQNFIKNHMDSFREIFIERSGRKNVRLHK